MDELEQGWRSSVACCGVKGRMTQHSQVQMTNDGLSRCILPAFPCSLHMGCMIHKLYTMQICWCNSKQLGMWGKKWPQQKRKKVVHPIDPRWNRKRVVPSLISLLPCSSILTSMDEVPPIFLLSLMKRLRIGAERVLLPNFRLWLYFLPLINYIFKINISQFYKSLITNSIIFSC